MKNDANEKNNVIFIRNCFHLKDFTEKSFQNPLVLHSWPFGKLRKFPYEGLFPFDRFPFYDYDLYMPMYYYYQSTFNKIYNIHIEMKYDIRKMNNLMS